MKRKVSIYADLILALVFMALRVTEVITWSWWWVISPVLVSAAIGLIEGAFEVKLLGVSQDYESLFPAIRYKDQNNGDSN
jgi:hypothetical protein